MLWRQSDIYFAALGGTIPGFGEHQSLDSVLSMTAAAQRALPAPPFMHGAAHWVALHAFHSGGMSTLLQDGARKVLSGKTTIQELLRVTAAV